MLNDVAHPMHGIIWSTDNDVAGCLFFKNVVDTWKGQLTLVPKPGLFI